MGDLVKRAPKELWIATPLRARRRAEAEREGEAVKVYIIEWFEGGEWLPATDDVFVHHLNAIERRDILLRLDPGRRCRVATYARITPGRPRRD